MATTKAATAANPGKSGKPAWTIATPGGWPSIPTIPTPGWFPPAGPRQAHDIEQAHAFVYRRTADTPWQLACGGLPHPKGTTIASIVAHPTSPATSTWPTTTASFTQKMPA
jgi:hypothetical protein